jgi:hypothetical protein
LQTNRGPRASSRSDEAGLDRLKENGAVRVIDAPAVHKDADGELEVAHVSNLDDDEAREFGRTIGALIGLGVEGEEGMEAGIRPGGRAAARRAPRAIPLRDAILGVLIMFASRRVARRTSRRVARRR